MEELIIEGGGKLFGSIGIKGAKNSILPIIACCVLTREPVTLFGCPRLSDIDAMLGIIRSMGGFAEVAGDKITICCEHINPANMDMALVHKIRSSIFILGALLSRCGDVDMTYPGGCEIGLRPIDIHLDGLRALGCEILEEDGKISCHTAGITGGKAMLRIPSVGATENIMMAAAIGEGRTIIVNAAKEPEIVDLACFIKASGGKIYGAGTSIIVIDGVKFLHGANYRPISDRITAGTYMIAAATCGGEVALHGIMRSAIEGVASIISACGAKVDFDGDKVTVVSNGKLSGNVRVVTGPYPGFPTDLQAPLAAMLCSVSGIGEIKETLFENRFKYASELQKMGAKIQLTNDKAIFFKKNLCGSVVEAKDLRGGAALVIAGMKAKGITVLRNVSHIDRGYEHIETELTAVGAKIFRQEANI